MIYFYFVFLIFNLPVEAGSGDARNGLFSAVGPLWAFLFEEVNYEM